jgi:AraC-like DNA-binding protein
MARPSKEPPASSTLVPAIVRHAQARGLDTEVWTWRYGLPHDVARREEVTVGASVPEELFRALATAASEPDAGLRVASELGDRLQRLAQLVVRASASVRDALVRIARWTPLLHAGLQVRLESEAVAAGDAARWVLRTPRRPRGVGRHVHELALANAFLQVRAGAGELPLARAWFVHARPAQLDGLQAFFGTSNLAFGCEDSGLAMAADLLDRPMRLADPRTVETLEPLVDEALASQPRLTSFAERVAAYLASSLPGCTDAGELARAMRMSTRTLQRRLEQEGTRFTDTLDRARLEVARGLLADPAVSLTEVAYRLGFADLATFSRAFKRWTGMPPGQWRRS